LQVQYEILVENKTSDCQYKFKDMEIQLEPEFEDNKDNLANNEFEEDYDYNISSDWN
jgi:hypothetical protein